jgi:hypothetical protein
LNVSFSGGERHESFEQSGASTARSFTQALVPIVEHTAQVIPQIAKIVNPVDYLFEFGFRQRANFAARSATGVANFEDSCELFQREADFERSPDKPERAGPLPADTPGSQMLFAWGVEGHRSARNGAAYRC